MGALIKKEISGFFSTLTGYVVIVVFLLLNGLFIWVFPGENNILETGYASLTGLFSLAPWIFLFLVPAVTMRSFAEEKKTGTLELLLTRPLSDLQIILAKYIAGVLLVVLALLPTLIYVGSIYLLGSPQGNFDSGATWGSYIGLFFLASIYVSIGIFSSSLTDNQIVAFIVAVLICFLIYIGFDFIGTMNVLSGINNLILQLGIEEHYRSISRGVIDSRDIVYFLGVNVVFITFTWLKLDSRKW